MDKKKLETFKKRLETRQQELRRTVNRNQADGRSADEDTAAADIADRAASSYTKEFLFSQSNNDRQCFRWWIPLCCAFAKGASANAFTAAKRSTPNGLKPCRGPVTVLSARKSWSRDCSKKLRAKRNQAQNAAENSAAFSF